MVAWVAAILSASLGKTSCRPAGSWLQPTAPANASAASFTDLVVKSTLFNPSLRFLHETRVELAGDVGVEAGEVLPAGLAGGVFVATCVPRILVRHGPVVPALLKRHLVAAGRSDVTHAVGAGDFHEPKAVGGVAGDDAFEAVGGRVVAAGGAEGAVGGRIMVHQRAVNVVGSKVLLGERARLPVVAEHTVVADGRLVGGRGRGGGVGVRVLRRQRRAGRQHEQGHQFLLEGGGLHDLVAHFRDRGV